MKNKAWKWIGLSAVGLLFLVASLIISHWALGFLDWARFAPGDLATWIGAVGTVCALFGTIYIARTETRRRERQERGLAHLHASAWFTRLVTAKAAVKEVIRILEEAALRPSDIGFAQDARATLQHIDTWSIEDLVPLLPLPDSAAQKLARAGSQIEGLRTIFDNEISKAEQFTNESRQRVAIDFAASTFTTLNLIDSALMTCRRVMREDFQ